MERRNLRSLLSVQARALFGVDLTEIQIGQFMTYLDELLTWNQTTNLTSITDEEAVVVKHFVDSIAGLRAQRFLPGARVLDVGSGAGFPGIPLKIVRPDCLITLVEPSKKKSSFLHFMVGALKLANTRVVTSTLEEFAAEGESRHRYNYVVTRALKYAGVLAKARELLADAGKVILYLSNPLPKSDIPQSWTLDSELVFDLPQGGGKRVLSVLYPAG